MKNDNIETHIQAIKSYITKQYDKLYHINHQVADEYKACEDIAESFKNLDKLHARINKADEFINHYNRFLDNINNEFTDWLHLEICRDFYSTINENNLSYDPYQKIDGLIVDILKIIEKMQAIMEHKDFVALRKDIKWEEEHSACNRRLDESIRQLKVIKMHIDDADSFIKVWKGELLTGLKI